MLSYIRLKNFKSFSDIIFRMVSTLGIPTDPIFFAPSLGRVRRIGVVSGMPQTSMSEPVHRAVKKRPSLPNDDRFHP